MYIILVKTILQEELDNLCYYNDWQHTGLRL